VLPDHFLKERKTMYRKERNPLILLLMIGALFPIIGRDHPRMKIPEWAMMFAKYFGSGVIICTAFIHVS